MSRNAPLPAAEVARASRAGFGDIDLPQEDACHHGRGICGQLDELLVCLDRPRPDLPRLEAPEAPAIAVDAAFVAAARRREVLAETLHTVHSDSPPQFDQPQFVGDLSVDRRSCARSSGAVGRGPPDARHGQYFSTASLPKVEDKPWATQVSLQPENIETNSIGVGPEHSPIILGENASQEHASPDPQGDDATDIRSLMSLQHRQLLSVLDQLDSHHEQQARAAILQLQSLEECLRPSLVKLEKLELGTTGAHQHVLFPHCAESQVQEPAVHILKLERSTLSLRSSCSGTSESSAQKSAQTPLAILFPHYVQPVNASVAAAELDASVEKATPVIPGVDHAASSLAQQAETAAEHHEHHHVVDSLAAATRTACQAAERTEDDLHWAWRENHRLMKVVHHPIFDAVAGLLILANSVAIGWEVNYEVSNPNDPSEAIRAMQFAFNIIFITELMLRLTAERLTFFTGKDRMWNALDLFLVFTSIALMAAVEITVALMSDAPEEEGGGMDEHFSTLRLLRVARCVRVARLFRVSRFIGELRLMMYLIICSFRSLLWVFVLLAGVMYIFAVIFTKAVAESNGAFELGGPRPVDGLEENYGSVWVSMYTLFKAAFGGDDWGGLVSPLWDTGHGYGAVFMIYESFMLLAVLNIVTGVFVDNAHKCAVADVDRVIEDEIANNACSIKELRKLFLQVQREEMELIGLDAQDADLVASTVISEAGFEQILKHEKMQAYFRVLGLDSTDGANLFRLLDKNSDGILGLEEFTEGCMKLRGGAKNIDITTLLQENKMVVHKVTKMLKAMQRETTEVFAQVRASTRMAEEQMIALRMSTGDDGDLSV